MTAATAGMAIQKRLMPYLLKRCALRHLRSEEKTSPARQR